MSQWCVDDRLGIFMLLCLPKSPAMLNSEGLGRTRQGNQHAQKPNVLGREFNMQNLAGNWTWQGNQFAGKCRNLRHRHFPSLSVNFRHCPLFSATFLDFPSLSDTLSVIPSKMRETVAPSFSVIFHNFSLVSVFFLNFLPLSDISVILSRKVRETVLHRRVPSFSAVFVAKFPSLSVVVHYFPSFSIIVRHLLYYLRMHECEFTVRSKSNCVISYMHICVC